MRRSACACLAILAIEFSAASAQVVIKTSDGNGADTELREDESSTRGGAKDLNTRWEANPSNLEVIALRFDLTGVDRTMISGAQLDLIVNRTGMPGNNGFDLFGLKANVAGQLWTEGMNNGVWNAANPFPGLIHDGNLATTPLDPTATVYLGSASWTTSPSQGSAVVLSSDSLSSFLHGAGDLTTLFVMRRVPTNAQMRFSSKETVSLGQTGTSLPFGTGEFAPRLHFDFAPQAIHNIYMWEYVDPTDHTLGKQQGPLYAPQGAGLHAVPGVDISDKDLSLAYLRGVNLTGANLSRANLTQADLSHANFSDAIFHATNLTDADLSEANLTNADFRGQFSDSIALLTRASLRGATLIKAQLGDVNLAGVDLSQADVRGAHLGFTGITLTQLYSTASYQQLDLRGVDLQGNDLKGANFVGQNLTNANLFNVDMTGVNLTGAEVRGATLGYFITLEQIYSTASYQARDLAGLRLWAIDLNGGNFVGQNLTNADFLGAGLVGTNLTGADMRGANAIVDDAIVGNLIRPNGHINGLDLAAGDKLVVRDYDDSVSIAISVDQYFEIAPGGTLQILFDDDAWDSTISFVPGIPVALGGTLELMFADNVILASQVGQTFRIFDWTGISPTGTFAVSSSYAWDLSNLYTTGEITLTAIPEPTSLVLLLLGILLIVRVRPVYGGQ